MMVNGTQPTELPKAYPGGGYGVPLSMDGLSGDNTQSMTGP